MNKWLKLSIFLITLAVAVALIIVIAQQKTVPKEENAQNQNPFKSTSSQTETTQPKTTQKKYTGYCTIVGKYRQRYVECTGDYDPAAKEKADKKAKECNESTKAVRGCTDKYY